MRKSRKEVLAENKQRVKESDFDEWLPDLEIDEKDAVGQSDNIEHTYGRHRSTSCSLFALSVVLFNVTACLIVWWFTIGR